MKSMFNHAQRSTLRAAAAGRLVFLAIVAVAVAADNRADSATATARRQTLQQTVVDSATLFAAGNTASAEAMLLQANLSQPNTADWNLESARRLVEMALSLQAQNNYASAREVAQRALSQLNTADARIDRADIPNKAQVLMQAAFIQDVVFGDSAAALAYYQQALALTPKSSHAAQEVARLSRVVAGLQKKKTR